MKTPIFDCGFEKSGKFHVKNDLQKNGFCDLGKVKNEGQMAEKQPDALFLNCLVFQGEQSR